MDTTWLAGWYVECSIGKADREGMKPAFSEMAAIGQRHTHDSNLDSCKLSLTNLWPQCPFPHLSIPSPSSLIFRALIFTGYMVLQTILFPRISCNYSFSWVLLNGKSVSGIPGGGGGGGTFNKKEEMYASLSFLSSPLKMEVYGWNPTGSIH